MTSRRFGVMRPEPSARYTLRVSEQVERTGSTGWCLSLLADRRLTTVM